MVLGKKSWVCFSLLAFGELQLVDEEHDHMITFNWCNLIVGFLYGNRFCCVCFVKKIIQNEISRKLTYLLCGK